MKPRTLIKCVLVIAVCVYAAVFFAYWAAFKGLPLSQHQDIWGQFGDYIGGLLNPALSFLALIALLFTIVQNQTELEETRKEAARSANALTQQAEHFERKEKVDELVRLIGQLHEDIGKVMAIELTVTVSHAGAAEPVVITESIGRLLSGHSRHEGLFIPMAMAQSSFSHHFHLVAGWIDELAEYLQQYTRLTRSRVLPRFYALRYTPSARVLEGFHYFQGGVVEYLESTLPENTR
ncbi:hypothetical protein Pres01_41200 [Metapseudomonas resinovorans]|uniref:hypothetical protein n=1 Tax=Metapseudomonas resinovorans TaxID=53412 RepID=UPI000984EE67|nr:hypothetical protein [Pseudomonas resinovorans]GLZ88069.1 hypothetical protein Pres01_41200 [Pseudomonas resinovorans]